MQIVYNICLKVKKRISKGLTVSKLQKKNLFNIDVLSKNNAYRILSGGTLLVIFSSSFYMNRIFGYIVSI
jgi:hypothetical protein